MFKSKTAKREIKQEERSNPLQSGLFFWISDCKGRAESSKELHSILNKYNLDIEHVISNTGRKAYYLNLPDHVTSFTIQSLYPELKRKSHITIDCEYYKEYAPVNDRLKWHYCHYTEEYYSPQSKELMFSVHQYFNKLGKSILTTITCKKTEKTTPLSDEQNKIIYLNLEHAKNIVSELIEAKSATADKHTSECNQLFDLVASSTASSHANLKPIDSEIIDANINAFKESAKLARRYADNFLQLPEKYLINLLATINQNIQHEKNTSGSPKPKIDSVNLEKTKKPIISPLKAIVENYKSLQKEWSELNKFNQAFLKPAELDGIIFAARDILNKLIEITPSKDEHQTYTAMVINITQFIKKRSKPTKTIQSELKGKPKDILKILQENFHAIEKDIPPDFYFNIINKAVECKNEDAKYYSDICEFLSQNSEKYLAILKPPYYDHPEKNPDSIYHTIHKCFIEQNPAAFEMLLRHGVKLGGKVFSDHTEIFHDYTSFGISLTKCLVRDFSFDLTKTDNLVQSIEDFKTFYNIMINPQFRSGVEHVDCLTGNLSKEALQSRAKYNRQSKPHPKNNIGKFLEENVAISSTLDFALNAPLPGSIVKLIADNTHENGITLFYLARNFAEYALGNKIAIVINDKNNHLGKITCSENEKAETDYTEQIFKSYADEAVGIISPRIYLSPLHLEGNPPEDVSEAMHSVIKLFKAKLENTSESDYKKTIDALLNKNMPGDISRYLGAIFMLISNENYDSNWKLLNLYDALLQAADRCFHNKKFDTDNIIKYLYYFHADVLYNELRQQPDTPETKKLISQIERHPKFEGVRDLALMYKLLAIAPIQFSRKPRP